MGRRLRRPRRPSRRRTTSSSWKLAGARATAIGPPSSSRRADACGSTCPGAVRYSEPNTIASASISSARSRSPSGVEPLRTTCVVTSGLPSARAAAASSSSASRSARRSADLLPSVACRTYASATLAPVAARTLPSASASRSLSVPSYETMIFVVTEMSSLAPGNVPDRGGRDPGRRWSSRHYVDVIGSGPPLPVAVAGWGMPDGRPSDGMSEGYTS